jgi:hypothetical protein
VTVVVALAPDPILQFFANDGTFLVGGQLFTTVGGVPYPTYADPQGLVQHANPIILNSRGEIATSSGQSAQLFLVPNVTYTFALFDAQSNPIDTPTNIQGIPTSDTIQALINQSFLGLTLYPRTDIEKNLGLVPLPFPYGDIRRYGADVTVFDNSAAINNALAVSAAGGAAAILPAGSWQYTADLLAPGGSSMRGVGSQSILVPNNCNGITFGADSTVLPPRFFRDFQILGTNTSSTFGLYVNFTAVAGTRVTSVQFENLTIQNFLQAVWLRGLWQSTFNNCYLYNNIQGYYFHGQNVVIDIIGGFIQKGTLDAAGVSYGVLTDSVDGETTQSLHMDTAAVYAYDINVCFQLVLFGTITNCDLSVCAQVGIQIVTCRGGIFIQNNWIQTNSSLVGTVGVQLTANGTPIFDKVVIENNNMVCQSPNAGSIGIDIQAGNINVTTNSNTIGSAFAGTQFFTGIQNHSGANNQIIKYNTIAAIGNAILLGSLSTNLDVGPNVVNTGGVLAFDGATPAGFSYWDRGTFTLTLSTGVAGTVTYLANGHEVSIMVASAGITNTSTATTITATGVPQYLWPNTDQTTSANVIDNGTGSFGLTTVTATGTISIRKDGNGSGFSGASGTKGLNGGLICYSLG